MPLATARNGHKYLTVVLDLERTKVVWVGEGRSKETLDKFFSEIGEDKIKVIKRRSYGFRDLTYFMLKIKQGFT